MAIQPDLDVVAQATQLLAECKITSAPTPVDKVAKFLGAQIRYSPLDSEISGMAYVADGVAIIGVNSLHHPNRQRFTIAHEIAHVALHRELISGEVHVDKKFMVLMRDSNSAKGTDQIEIQANKFAAELLIPTSLLEPILKDSTWDIDDDQSIEKLAKKFRVSRQALEFKIRNM